jgi:murein L,D-transpeptidase YafK
MLDTPRLRFLVSVFVAVSLGGLPAAVADETQPLPPDIQADEIVIEKARHTLTLKRKGETLRVYAVALGRGGLEPKRHQGDNRTPEGRYRISGRNPHSSFHLSLRISYPSARDAAEAAARGEDPGGDIMIHGIRNGMGWVGALHRSVDWTAGCIALTDQEIEEIWRVVPDGTPVEIRP